MSPFVSLSELNLSPPEEFSNPPHSDDSDTEALSPEELEEKVAKYHHFPKLLKLLKSLSISKPAKPTVSAAFSKSPQVFPIATSDSNSNMSPLQKAMKEASQVGEDMKEFHCFR
jgi:hypothetical protein